VHKNIFVTLSQPILLSTNRLRLILENTLALLKVHHKQNSAMAPMQFPNSNERPAGKKDTKRLLRNLSNLSCVLILYSHPIIATEQTLLTDKRIYAKLIHRHTAQPIYRTPFRVQHPNTPLPLALAHYHTSLATPPYTQSSPINPTNAQARLVSPRIVHLLHFPSYLRSFVRSFVCTLFWS
jgi:hypothetical protein